MKLNKKEIFIENFIKSQNGPVHSRTILNAGLTKFPDMNICQVSYYCGKLSNYSDSIAKLSKAWYVSLSSCPIKTTKIKKAFTIPTNGLRSAEFSREIKSDLKKILAGFTAINIVIVILIFMFLT